jgi:dipeptidyl aminopeptidase/acylaminoacyl peptidase
VSARRIIAATAVLAALCVPATAQATTVPGANARIAFSNGGDIYTVNPDGTGLTNLTNGTVPQARMPSWSPDATQITFSATANTAGYSDIFVIDAAGGPATNITNTPSIYEFESVWSPDGAKIAFVSDEAGGDNDIFAMNTDGSGRTDLSNNGYFFDNSPAWSPDGTRIAFETQRETDNFNYAIWVMKADGSAQTDVTQNLIYHGYVEANWSPDGAKIVFAASGTPQMPLQTINPDGTGQASMLGSAPGERDPVWSPDGQKVAFQTSFNGDIYTRNIDGSGTTHVAAGAHADWARIPSNAPPDCSTVSADRESLRPPNHQFRLVALRGASDPDGDPVAVDITGVTQDEPVRGVSDKKAPDARVTSKPDQVRLRAERDPQGDGRVYAIAFTVSDGQGGECEGTTEVEVPRHPGRQAVDSAPPSYDSFGH